MYPGIDPDDHPLIEYMQRLNAAYLGETESPDYPRRVTRYLNSLSDYFNPSSFARMCRDWRRITHRIRVEWNGKYALMHVVKHLFFQSTSWAAEYAAEQQALLQSFETSGEDTMRLSRLEC